ncbi:hypothetical protein BKD30_03525 [Tersicoccus phoenicis]|uniref:Prepilin type IV endopeptidase peptidase domain-containing protein n=1 Tax=Tersicoccus phoenicis TaxID=554083 RepID=A0A1R1LJS0_9MICC|nr:hypothetical protein BKD30_03525 [Tersicoccus phoenicis]
MLVLAGVVGLAAGRYARHLVTMFEPAAWGAAERESTAAGSVAGSAAPASAAPASAATAATAAGAVEVAASRPPRRALLELLTALVFAALTWRFGLSPALPVLLFVATVGIALAVIDLRHRRLPNAVVLPSLGITALLVVAAAVARADGGSVARAALGSVILFALYLLLALINPAGMGMGDVKLAALIGLVLAFQGWSTMVVGAFFGFAVGAVVSIGVLVTRRGGLRSTIPFGPSMLVGALLASLV